METQSGQRCHVVRTDKGRECDTEYFTARGIVHQTSVSYNPVHNGAAKRLNRTLLERVRAILADAGSLMRSGQRRFRPPTMCAYVPRRRQGQDAARAVLRIQARRLQPARVRYNGIRLRAKDKADQVGVAERSRSRSSYSSTVKGYRILLDDHHVEISRDVSFAASIDARPSARSCSP